jgi:hypothetical protein
MFKINSVAALLASAAMTVAASAQLNLPPGGLVTPPAVNFPAAVIHDVSIPFDIFNAAGARLFHANLHDRVDRLASGQLVFDTRIGEITPGLNGIVNKIDRFNFGTWTTKVSYDPTSVGVVAPQLAYRSAGTGADIQWRYAAIQSTADSKFAEITTTATSFNLKGFTVITLTTGESVVLTGTSQPGVGTPTAVITGPAPLSCACNPITITGTADGGGDAITYTLEYSANPAGPWTNIITSSIPVINGTLASWNTSAIPTGNYFVRLRVLASDGTSDSFTTMMHVDSSAPTVDFRTPVNTGLYGGIVCFDGTVLDDACFDHYTIAFQKGRGAWNQIVSSNNQVINDPLGSWDTNGLADGDYNVRVQAFDACGHVTTVIHTITVDNTVPVGVITSPTNCDSVRGQVPVIGTAFDTHVSYWDLAYVGGPANSFVTITSGTSNVVNGVLGLWDTTLLPPCCYTLRLRVFDSANVNCGNNHETDYYVSVDIADPTCGADFNHDGGIDFNDVEAFFSVWENGGC